MPRILRIINRFNLGGPTFNAAYLTKYMPDEYETLLIGGQKDKSEASSEFILKKLNISPVIIPEMQRPINVANDYSAYRKIKKLIRDFGPDIVHTHASKAGTLGRLAASSLKVPVKVHTFHGHVFHSYFGKVKSSVYRNIERALARKSEKIIAISEIQKKELAEIHRICSPEKIAVIPLGFDLSRFMENMEGKRSAFRKKFNLKEDEIAVGIIGRLVPVKNHDLFIRALKKVFESTSRKVRAFIIGDGSERTNLELLAAQLGIPYTTPADPDKRSLLTFTSWIKEIDQANAGMDIIALTSYNEGTPVSLIEAQASEKPIVSTAVGGIENVVAAGKTALLSPSDDLEKFTENLMELIESKALRADLSRKGRAFVQKKFHYMRLVDDMDRLYKQLLA